MVIAAIVGILIGGVLAVWLHDRAVSGANRSLVRNPNGSVFALWPTTVGAFLLWGGIAFGITLGIVSAV